MIAEHNVTVLPFRDAALRRPMDIATRRGAEALLTRDANDLPDNVVPLTRFARASRRAHHRFWPGGPPEGEAA